MLFKIVVLCALVSSPAFASAIKGYSGREETKGGRLASPIEQQKLLADPLPLAPTKGGSKLEHVQQQPIKQQHELDLPAAPIKAPQESIKSPKEHFEARPQVNREELAKGQQEVGQVQLSRQVEQQREEALPVQAKESYEQQRAYAGKVEQQELQQQQQEEERSEQVEQREYGSQQIEIRDIEQRRFGDSPLIQPILPLTIVEESTREQQLSTKGGSASAKVPEAEPYAFSYQVDGSSRSESGDTKGVVRGQYTLQGADGSSRVVDYVADENGFRAAVNTNEFGTEARSPANIALRSSQPLAQDITLKLEGKTREDLSVKGAPLPAPVPAKPDNWSVKSSPLPAAKAEEPTKGERRLIESPAKGQRLVQEQAQLEHSQVSLEQQAPIKSAELTREPKSSNFGEQKQLTRSASASVFESATAHREYRPAAPISNASVRSSVLRPQPPPAVRAPPQAVSRAYLQRERYPPSPVQGYRRQQPQVVANPRVSFYSSPSASFDDEQPLGLEQPAEFSS